MKILFVGFTLLMGMAVTAPCPGQDPSVVLRAGPRQVALLELFTSEGCSSCPPAERWLGALRSDPDLWRTFVPVAFHVNYWDHLGWRDILAAEAYTARQQRHAAAGGATTVYTPAFVRAGVEWRPHDSPGAGPAGPLVGTLTLAWNPAANSVAITFASANPLEAAGAAALETWVALLGGGIVSRVARGENSGRELHHEFAVLRLGSTALRRNAAGDLAGTVTLPPRTDLAVARRAIAGWVSRRGSVFPLQAAGGWIEAPPVRSPAASGDQ